MTAKPVAIITIVVLSVTIASFIILQPNHQFKGIFKAASHTQGCDRPPGYVSLIIDSSGFNDSKAQITPSMLSRLLQFQKGETVNLLVCNLDTEPHGFAITHYADTGVTLSAGGSYTISFVAEETGDFTIYCNILCALHPFLLGKLVVA